MVRNRIMKVCGFSAVVIPEGKLYSSWCPELDVASQGDTIEEALANLKEAVELHIECLTPSELREIKERQSTRILATLEIPIPQ